MLDVVNKPQILEIASKGLNFTIYDCKWVPVSARFVVLGSYPRATGSLQIFELDGSKAKLLREVEKESSFKCGTFGASSMSERNLATGDYNGKLSIWNLEDLDFALSEIKAHEGGINGMDGCGGEPNGHGPPEIVTCGRDGCVKVFDVRDMKSAVAAFEPISGSLKRECWCVAFGNSYNDTERCVLAGYDNGDVKLFDLRKNQIRWETTVKSGVCGVQFDRRDIEMNKLVISCLESRIHVFDCRTEHPEKGFASLSELTGFNSTCWDVKHLPQNREVFMVTHGDGTLALSKYKYPPRRQIKDKEGRLEGVVGSIESLGSCNFSSQPISCFDWSPDKEGLFVSGALDQRIRVGVVTKLRKI